MSKKDVAIQVKLTSKMRREFQRAASDNMQNPSVLIRYWIKKYIEENKEK